MSVASDFVQRGRQLLEQGQFQEAVKVCRLGLLASPTALEGRLVLGSALMALRRFDEVLAEMRVALEIDGSSAWGLALKGESLLRKGDAAQACDVLTRAMASAPADTRIRELYGEARRLREQGVVVPRPTADGNSSRFTDGGMSRPTGPQASRAAPSVQSTVAGHRRPLGASTGTGTGTGVSEHDPATEVVDYVEPEPFIPAARDQSSSSIELDTGDIVPIESPGPSRGREPAPAGVAASVRNEGDQVARRGGRPVEVAVEIPAGRGRKPKAATGGPPLDEMFPDDEDGVSKLEMAEHDDARARGADDPVRRLSRGSPSFGGDPLEPGDGRSQTDDMRTIRQGLGLPAEGTSPGRQVPPEILQRERAEARRAVEERRSRMTGPQPIAAGPAPSPAAVRPAAARAAEPRPTTSARRGLPLWLYAVVALLVVGGAVFAGFEVRAMRLARQIRAGNAAALAHAATDTYRGYLQARDGLARILRVQADRSARAAHARMVARLFAEFGDGEADAVAVVAGVAEIGGADVLAARAYLALGQADAGVAQQATAALAQGFPGDRDADYLVGRAALLVERPREAAEALRRAYAATPRPLVGVHLAIAEAGQGKVADALAVLDRVRRDAPRHVGATIWHALILARAELVATATSDPAAPLAELIADGARPLAEQAHGVAPSELAWAELALAEVALARGEADKARAALARAGARRPGDPRFAAALAEALLRAGDGAAARAEVARLVERDPRRAEVHILAARVALAAGDALGTLAALERAGNLATRPDALALRGRAELLAGAVDKAAADLDAALAVRPDLLEAVVARAEVDLARGEARVALKRLEPLYQGAAAGSVELAVTYAEAVRQAGDLTQAHAILDKLGGSPPSYGLSLARGRIARAEGGFGDARRFFDKARELNPAGIGARLELASLSLDVGDAAAHRALLDGLVTDAPDNGVVLVEAAMARTLTGDADGAQGLLDRAGSLGSTPQWRLYRERGRVALRRGDAVRAVAELERAKGLRLDDAELHLLLLEAHLVSRSKAGAQRSVEDAAKSFRGTATVALAKGVAALLEERSGEAIEEFLRAHTLLGQSKASPREIARAAFWLGRAFYLEGNLGKATEWLTRATEVDPSQADAFFYLGQVADESGAVGKMVTAYERSVAIDGGGNPLAWFFLAEHYAKTRQNGKAKAACAAYLKRWPQGDFAEPLRTLDARLR